MEQATVRAESKYAETGGASMVETEGQQLKIQAEMTQ